MAEFQFTEEEVEYIDKKLRPVIFDWAKTLISHIIGQARNLGVQTVYMNTPETLKAGEINEAKKRYFYEKLPPSLGFKEEITNLRGEGKEILWAYHFVEISASLKKIILKTAGKQFTLDQIPKKYQGMFVSVLGRRDFYTDEEVRQMLAMIDKKQSKPKSVSKFYYDWNSRVWTGGQRFTSNVSENVVLQKLTTEMQQLISSDDILRKFWAYILNYQQHFGSDVIGFALVSKISPTKWVINEIQSDCLNHYLDLRSKTLKWKDKRDKKENIDWDTVKDMLVAQNKDKWISKIEMNEEFKNKILRDPNIISQLPDNTHDIDAWIQTQRDAGRVDLIQHFQSVNFNSRIFRTY